MPRLYIVWCSGRVAFSNPATKVQAVAELMIQNGITVHDLFALAGASQQYQQYAQHYGGDPVAQQMQDQQGMQQAHQQLTQFSQGKPHFEKVRYRMGELIQATWGSIHLAGWHRKSRQSYTLMPANKRALATIGVPGANVSPRSRSPAVAPDTPMRGGSSVRNSIIAAYQAKQRIGLATRRPSRKS